MDVAMRRGLNAVLVDAAEKFSQRPAQSDNRPGGDERPDEYLLLCHRVARGVNVNGDHTLPNHPKRNCYPAGKQTSNKLNRDSREVGEPHVVGGIGRAEMRGRENGTGVNAIM